MIKTSRGEEVARISAVDEDGNTIIDEFLKPLGEVEDYRTQFSGITEELLTETDDKKLLSSDECCEVLSKVAYKHTIIVGHSLENDLRAMKIIHDRVIDTALLYNTETRYPNKPSLSKLYHHYISKDFRKDSETKGHDSVEDARASLMLAKHAMKAEVTEVEAEPKMPTFFTKVFGNTNRSNANQNTENSENQNNENSENQNEENSENLGHQIDKNQESLEHQDNENSENIEHQNEENSENLEHQNEENSENLENQNDENEIPKCFKELKKTTAQINVFGPVFHINFSGIDDSVRCTVGATAEEVINSFLTSLDSPEHLPTLTYAYFHSLSRCELVEEEEIEACKVYNDVLQKTLEKVPPQSAIIAYTANGNLKRLRSNTSRARPGNDAERLAEFTLCRQGLLWVVCKNHGDSFT